MIVSFIFAHPDDETLSAGGTIAKYVSKGYNVSILCLTSDSIRKAEYLEAVSVLGVENAKIFDFSDRVEFQIVMEYSRVGEDETEKYWNLILIYEDDTIQFQGYGENSYFPRTSHIYYKTYGPNLKLADIEK